MEMENRPLVYVTRDIERALGIEPSSNYLVVSNRTEYSESIQRQYKDFVYLIDSEKGLLDTNDLLKEKEVENLINAKRAHVLVFKNNANIEAIAKNNGWDLLNPSAIVSENAENKITQIEWFGDLATKYFPSFSVGAVSTLKWPGTPSILQWAHGHTGASTFLVNSESDLESIQKSFPNRPARMTQYIPGPCFTVNIAIVESKILLGNISYQITGLQPFTDNQFATVGNDWKLANDILSEDDVSYIHAMAEALGKKMKVYGWRGLFGIDLIKDEKTGKIYLIEVNGRQPASSTFESYLQKEERRQGNKGITIFEAHINGLLKKEVGEPIVKLDDGAQIVQRISKSILSIPEDAPGSLELSGYIIVTYQNTEYNSDLIRIQSLKGIMSAHNVLSQKGKDIVSILSNF